MSGRKVIVVDAHLLPNSKFKIQRARTHKKKRLDKKYLKKYGFKDVEICSDILVIYDNLFMSKKTYNKIKVL